MTTDEFHGHLMAALHGPKADEVAGRVFDVARETFGIQDLMKMVQALAMLAVADVDPRMSNARRKLALSEVVKKVGREMYLDPFKDRLEEVEGGSIISDLFGDD